MADINLKISSAGLDTGPFKVTDNLGNTLATGVTRQQLLDGIDITGIDDSVTLITVTSTGVCTNSKSLVVDFTGGGGTPVCKNVRFYISGSSCAQYSLTVSSGFGQARFAIHYCDNGEADTIVLNDNEYWNGCLRSGSQAPVVTQGTGNISMLGTCTSGTATYPISFTLCDGTPSSVTLSNTLTEYTACIQSGSESFPEGITAQILGDCSVE